MEVENNTDLVFISQTEPAMFYTYYRVCLRYSDYVQLYIDDELLVESLPSTTFDATLVGPCLAFYCCLSMGHAS